MDTEVRIKLSELQDLKNQKEQAEAKVYQLEKELNLLEVESLKKQAVDLANLMFFEVIKKTMLTLGIDDISRSQTWFKFSDLKSHLGETFYNHEKLDIEIGLVFTNKIKEGFIKLMILK